MLPGDLGAIPATAFAPPSKAVGAVTTLSWKVGPLSAEVCVVGSRLGFGMALKMFLSASSPSARRAFLPLNTVLMAGRPKRSICDPLALAVDAHTFTAPPRSEFG